MNVLLSINKSFVIQTKNINLFLQQSSMISEHKYFQTIDSIINYKGT